MIHEKADDGFFNLRELEEHFKTHVFDLSLFKVEQGK
jgi:hypothetical protein